MKALVVRCNQKPQIEEINDDIKTLQNIVGGYIECITIDRNVVLVCNEEGKLRNLCPNRLLFMRDDRHPVDIICGDFFIVGVDDEDFTSLSDSMIEKWKRIYSY